MQRLASHWIRVIIYQFRIGKQNKTKILVRIRSILRYTGAEKSIAQSTALWHAKYFREVVSESTSV